MKKFLSILGFAAKEAEKVAVISAPIVAQTVGGPVAGNFVQNLLSEIETAHQNGVTVDKELVKVSVGHIIEGVVGLLQATGRLPIPKAGQ